MPPSSSGCASTTRSGPASRPRRSPSARSSPSPSCSSPAAPPPATTPTSGRTARAYGVHAHTHLAETRDEERYCLETFGRTPVELAEDLGWVGPDVWHAHLVHPRADEVARLGRTRTGAAHCPSSNMRLASGIAPLRALRAAG